MKGVYDRPLKSFIGKFKAGWHVLLEADGASEPSAHLRESPTTGKLEVAGEGASPLQQATDEQLDQTMVREVSRDEKKRIIVVAVQPTLLKVDPPVVPEDPEVDWGCLVPLGVGLLLVLLGFAKGC